jgi:hypothetical protein
MEGNGQTYGHGSVVMVFVGMQQVLSVGHHRAKHLLGEGTNDHTSGMVAAVSMQPVEEGGGMILWPWFRRPEQAAGHPCWI